jgi:putative ABC transport system permease protein
MLKNYLKVAVRTLGKQKAFVAINAAGLALGVAAFLMILQYVAFESGVNGFHRNGSNIYRVVIQGDEFYSPLLAPAIAPALKENLPEILTYARTAEVASGVVTYFGSDTTSRRPLKSFRETKGLYADGDFLKIFSFPVVQGTASLHAPQTVALSEGQARKYFGSENPLGKVLVLNNQFGNTPYTVTGVFEDVPANSDLQFDMLLSLQTLAIKANRNNMEWADPEGWDNGFVTALMVLKDGTDASRVEAKANDLRKRLRPEANVSIRLQSLAHVHLAPYIGYPLPTAGQLELVLLLAGVAVLVLVIAWVNYVNLSTAYALNRAKEVGIRKVVGASRGQLIAQYLFESLLLNLIGVAFALMLVHLVQPFFNSLIDIPLSLQVLNQSWFWAGGSVFILLGTLISGGYVAVVLSSYQPIRVLKGSLGKAAKGGLLRKGLVVFQFAVTILFIAGTFVLYRQMQFMREKQQLGMNIDQLLVVKGPSINSPERGAKGMALRQELRRLSFVTDLSGSGSVPGSGFNFFSAGITSQKTSPENEKKDYAMLFIDEQYLNVYDIPLAAGRNFTPAMVGKGFGSGYLIINESASRQLGFADPQEAVGKTLSWGDKYEVIGVVKDYHHASVREAIYPTIFAPANADGAFSIKTSAGGMPEKLAKIQKIYASLFPADPFEYFFADENYDKQYQAEKKLSGLFTASSVLAVCIACLGLFGLAAFTAAQRTKEVGIRKVLGAGVMGLVGLLAKDYLKLVGIAFVLAVPVTWYVLKKGLQTFAYRVPVPVELLAATGLLVLLIALLPVCYHSLKAALANPADSLRSE